MYEQNYLILDHLNLIKRTFQIKIKQALWYSKYLAIYITYKILKIGHSHNSATKVCLDEKVEIYRELGLNLRI